jgi:hypothetical protein
MHTSVRNFLQEQTWEYTAHFRHKSAAQAERLTPHSIWDLPFVSHDTHWCVHTNFSSKYTYLYVVFFIDATT